MLRFVLSGVVLVLIIAGAILILPVLRADTVDVSSAIPLADDTISILVDEYYYDFEPRYRSIEETESIGTGSCASRILFESDRDDCIRTWASRRFDFTTESSNGFLSYHIMETDYHAHRYLNETLERIRDPNESIPIVRWSTTGLAGFSDYEIGRDVDEFLAIVVRAEEGYIHFLAQRMGRIVIVSFEESPNSTIQRKYRSATTYSDHFRIIAYREDAQRR